MISPRKLFACCFYVLGLLSLTVQARAAEFSVGATPTWVKTIAPGASDSPVRAAASGGAFHLLVDRQVKANGRQTQFYRRFVSEALNAQGLDEVANIQIYFNPAFERVVVHSLKVIRDGKPVERVDQVQFNVLQRETDLEYQVYDEGRTASVFLKDIRVGDKVDYAYTIEGSNPVFGEHSFGRAGMQYSQPVARLNLRLLYPDQGAFEVFTHGAVQRSKVIPLGGRREESWSLTDVAALNIDAQAPSWHDPYPSVSWTTFADWSDVVAWAQPLYRVPVTLPEPMQAQVDKIRAEYSTPAQRTAAALRWVQAEFRYLAMPIGIASHAPNSPELVVERRFGDCKDKTLLLLSLLDALGVDAYPALVNTEVERGLRHYAPNPAAFNHVLVMAHLGGADYWLDPTRDEQQGDLDQVYQPDFELALVVRDDVNDLQAMTAKRINLRQVQVIVDASRGFDDEVELTVTTTTQGAQTDTLRRTLATSSRNDMQQKYLNFYASYYRGISVREPMQVESSKSGHQIQVVENYSLGSIASLSEETQRYEAPVYTPDVLEYLSAPQSLVRNAPLQLDHPLEVTQVTQIKLPEDWNVEESVTEVKDAAFTFRREVKLEDKVVTLNDQFTTLADHVPADEMARYAENLASARRAASFEFYWPNAQAEAIAGDATDDATDAGPPSGLHPGAVAGAIASVLIAIGLAILLYRFDPVARYRGPPHDLQGISGWLILPAIAALVMPLMFGHALYGNYTLLEQSTWIGLVELAGGQIVPMYLMLAMSFIASPLLLALSILFAVLFFQRRTSAPALFITLMACNLTVLLAEYLFMRHIGMGTIWTEDEMAQHLKSMLQLVVRAVIWIPYFLVSQRVRVTFTRRRVATPFTNPPIAAEPAHGDEPG